MLTKTFPAATAENVTYTYDAFTAGTNHGRGRLTGITDQSGSTAFIYDARGNVTRETRVISGVSYQVNYVYNLADQVTQITYPSGRIVIYGRDAQGRITGVTTKQNATAATVNPGLRRGRRGDVDQLPAAVPARAAAVVRQRSQRLEHLYARLSCLSGAAALARRIAAGRQSTCWGSTTVRRRSSAERTADRTT